MHMRNGSPLMDSGFPTQNSGGGVSGGGLSGGGSGGGGMGGGGGEHAPSELKPKIMHTQATAITKKSDWKRKPNSDGKGATHLKSFHCRLNTESVELLDQQINEWLDLHPELEVKLVNTSIGEWQGKIKEPNLIVQVWV